MTSITYVGMDVHAQLNEQYAAIKYMFSECLEKIREIKNFVQD